MNKNWVVIGCYNQVISSHTFYYFAWANAMLFGGYVVRL